MIHALLMFLNHPISSALPLVLRFSPLQLLSVLLAALASSRALTQMEGRSVPALSAQVMLSLALLSIILASNLPESDARPDLGMALVLRLVLGGLLVSVWNALHFRSRAVPVRSD